MTIVTGPSWALAHIALKFPLIAVAAASTFVYVSAKEPIAMSVDRLPVTNNRPMVAITFDDGYQSVHDIALVEMSTRGMVGTNFVTIQHINSGDFYIDDVGLNNFIDAGWEIGGHGISHLDVTLLNEEELIPQLNDPVQELFNLTGQTPSSFASPYGEFNESVIELVRQTYSSHVNAWSSARGMNTLDSFDPYNVHRVDFYDTSVEEICATVFDLPDDSLYVPVFHNISDRPRETAPFDISPSDMIAVISCIYNANVDIVLLSEGVDMMLERQAR